MGVASEDWSTNPMVLWVGNLDVLEYFGGGARLCGCRTETATIAHDQCAQDFEQRVHHCPLTIGGVCLAPEGVPRSSCHYIYARFQS